MLVGVLALQGDYGTHADALNDIGVDTVLVRKPEDAGFANPSAERTQTFRTVKDGELRDRPVPDALVLPGGESSTFDLLGRRYGLDRLVASFAASGKTVLGTCAGAIWLGKGDHHKVTPLGLIDVDVQRNAYGRQVDSHISPIEVKGLDEPFEAVFIRAPIFTRVGKDVEVLSEHRGQPVLVRSGNLWMATFHPERTPDRRLHELIFKRS